jgi:ribosome-associated translation inhibitor RaiA
MTRPLQLTFRHMQVSADLETAIHDRAADLETCAPGIIGCDVTVEVPHHDHAHGRHVHVRVEVALPGEDIVVSREGTAERALVAVHEAFDIARRRLQDRVGTERDARRGRREAAREATR